MSLKDELEKLIKAEQSRLDETKKDKAEFENWMRQRFLPLRTVLEEICKSVESRLLNCTFYDHSAFIEFGSLEDGFRYNEIEWEIKTYAIDYTENEIEGSSSQKSPKYKLKEIDHRSSSLEKSVTSKDFNDEESISNYLIGIIAKRIALHRHSISKYSNN